MESAGSTPAPSENTPTDETTTSVEAAPTEHPVAVGDEPPSDATGEDDAAGMPGEIKPAASATVATGTAPSAPDNSSMETTAPMETAAAMETSTVPADLVGVGTSSQDEEEGVSDVESEKSQEPSVKTADISEMAARLLDSWKDLKVRLSRTPPKQFPFFLHAYI